jgi:hypothetical protein
MKYFSSNTFILAILLPLIIIVTRCANVVPPGGGPKDKDPAKVKNTIPQEGSTNFKGQYIIMEFDELVRLDNIAQKALVTPFINPNNIEYKLVKNKLVIKLDSLEENTTYNFSFPDCIKDVNEGNSTVYQIAFSTGPYLDSASISGKINHPTGANVKEALVALYKGSFDTSFLSKRPQYLSKVKDGNYRLNNLKSGIYTQLVWIDDNKNNKWDKGKEKASFEYPIQLDTSIELNHTLYKYDDRKPKYSYSQKFDKTVILNFDEPIYRFSSQPYVPYKINKDAVELYSKEITSFTIEYNAQDSSDNVLQDTILLEFKESKIKNSFTYTLSPIDYKLFQGDTIELKLTKPITLFDTSKVHMNVPYTWKYDSLNQRLLLSPKEIKDTIKLKSENGFCLSEHLDSLDALNQNFFKANVEDYGSIEYEIVTTDNQFIAHLINKKGAIINTVINNKKGYAKNLYPDTYSFLYIQDTNGNGKWDRADIINNTKAEKIIYVKKTIVLKANWEIKGQKIDISEH